MHHHHLIRPCYHSTSADALPWHCQISTPLRYSIQTRLSRPATPLCISVSLDRVGLRPTCLRQSRQLVGPFDSLIHSTWTDLKCLDLAASVDTPPEANARATRVAGIPLAVLPTTRRCQGRYDSSVGFNLRQMTKKEGRVLQLKTTTNRLGCYSESRQT